MRSTPQLFHDSGVIIYSGKLFYAFTLHFCLTSAALISIFLEDSEKAQINVLILHDGMTLADRHEESNGGENVPPCATNYIY